jgi:enoyl-CoA hydratase/carnithine racemase
MSVLVEDRARPGGGLVRTVTIARPDRRNALDPSHLQDLGSALVAAAGDPQVRALVIAGQGTAFCAGYDLGNPLAAAGAEAPDALVLETMAAVQACQLPTIARVQGPAFGAGLHLAIACDLRVASEKASFCLPPAKLGIAYAPEGLSRLAALVGTSTARRLAFTGEVVSASRALALRLVDELTGTDDLDARVEALANALADAAPLAVRAMKRSFNALEAALASEARALAEQDRLACYGSEDAREGLRAFAEKRAPVFLGR